MWFYCNLALGLLCSLGHGQLVVNTTDRQHQHDDGGLFELTILHTNDMQSRFDQTDAQSNVCRDEDVAANRCYGGFGRLVHTVRQFRSNSTAAPVLYLDAGDVFSGTPWYTVHGEPIVSTFMNLLRPDAQCLGNHEFDLGTAGLRSYVRNVRFPVLATSLNLTAVPSLAAEETLRRSVIVDVGTLRIGIVSYLTPMTQNLSQPTDIGFDDEVTAVNAEVSRLRDTAGIRTVIALGHSDLATDRRIAAECTGVDIVIGGHHESFLWNTDDGHEQPPVEDRARVAGPYPLVVEQPGTGKRVPILQAYAFTKYIGRLCVRIASDGSVRSFDGQPLLLDGRVPRDPEALALMQLYRTAVHEATERPAGESLVRLNGTCAAHETNAGNLVTDALLHAHAMAYVTGETERTAAAAAAPEQWTDCAVAFFLSGAMSRFSHTVGKWTMGDLMMLLPYDTRFYTVWLSGMEILKMLENSVARYTRNDVCLNEFLQMSGVRVVYNVSRPAGQRVQLVELMCTECKLPHYEPLRRLHEYKCIVSDHMSRGGDGYTMLPNKRYFNYTVSVLEAVQNYMQRRRRVYPAIEGRIRIVGTVITVQNEMADGEVGEAASSSAISSAVSLSVMLLVALQLAG